jgi:4-alpha-glucanotransferase
MAKYQNQVKKKETFLDLNNLINQSVIKSLWEKIGAKHHHGISTPLASLKTKKSSGIGEFLDLLPLIDFLSEFKFDILQLLPLNDSGLDPSPYNALSALALNPIYISLHALPFVEEKELNSLQALNEEKIIPYGQVLEKKINFLSSYYEKHFDKIRDDLSYKAFIETTSWLKPYALFKVLRNRFNYTSWQSWPEELQKPTQDFLEKMYALEASEMEFYFMLQYFCFRQLKWVKTKANEKNIFLKGDIPILISPDSVDVWINQNIFNLDFVAGAPPDMFTPEGQYWGFPTFKWGEIEITDFAFWRERLNVASEFYDIFRIDHIIGFYRIWAIEKNKSAKEGQFFPQEREEAILQGEYLLKKILSFTHMFPIGEDLGLFIDHIRKSLFELTIPGTKIPRWERHYESDQSFIKYEDYPIFSLTTLSTHDTETLNEWWMKFPEDAKKFCIDFNLDFNEKISKELRIKILKGSHKSASLFHINLLIEFLSLIDTYQSQNPEEDRINLPGKVTKSNWCHRYIPYIEEFTQNITLKESLKTLLDFE